jgi:predicted metalloprotease
MARKKDPRRWLLEAWEYAQMTPEEEIERIQAALKVLETPEQKRQREEAKRRRALAKRRRALAKIGLTPEEFDARVREFERKFFREQE